MIVQTTVPKVGLLEKGAYEYSLHDLEKRPDSRSSKASSRASKTASQVEMEIERAKKFDKFVEMVHAKSEHDLDFGMIPSRVQSVKEFEIKNLNDVPLSLDFRITPDEHSDMAPDGVSSVFSVAPVQKLKLAPGQFEIISVQVESKYAESRNKAKIEIFADKFEKVLHTMNCTCDTTSLPVFFGASSRRGTILKDQQLP